MSKSLPEQELQETSADLAYLAYQLRKTTEKLAVFVDTYAQKAETANQRRQTLWIVLVSVFIVSLMVDVFLRIFLV